MTKVLTFALRGELYGVPIEPVREIIGLTEVTAVPMMPGFMRGVMNLRGHVVPVIDVGVRLGLPPAADSGFTCILMIDVRADDENLLVGVQVDAVHEVMRVEASALAATPGFGTRVPPHLIAGMLPLDSSSMVMLDLSRVLAVDELEADVELAA
jgi:purine-binding chemotaxis protein CheW